MNLKFLLELQIFLKNVVKQLYCAITHVPYNSRIPAGHLLFLLLTQLPWLELLVQRWKEGMQVNTLVLLCIVGGENI